MDTERIRNGVVVLCFAAGCGLLFLVTRESDWSQPFAIAGVVAALVGLARVATGVLGGYDAEEDRPD